MNLNFKMVLYNQYSHDYLSSCNYIENGIIQIKPNMCIRTQLGIIKCIQSFSIPKMLLLLNITKTPCFSKTQTINMCNDKITISYNPLHNNDLNVIIAPNNLISSWEKITSNEESVTVVGNVQDSIDLQNDYKRLFCP